MKDLSRAFFAGIVFAGLICCNLWLTRISEHLNEIRIILTTETISVEME